MRAQRIALASFAAFAVALACFGAWAWPRRVDPHADQVYAARLSRIETLLHRLHEQVLRAHAGLAGSYDPIVQTVHELREVHEAVAVAPAFVDDASRARIEEERVESAAIVEAETALVERFKTENAVLLNSLRFFPVAAAEVATQLEATPGSEEAAAELRRLLRDVLLLVVAPSEEIRRAVAEHLQTLSTETVGRDITLLLRHASVVSERRASVDQLLHDIFEQDDLEHARALAEAYDHAHAQALRRDDANRLTFFVLAIAVVVLGAAAIILRLKASGDALADKSEQLARAIEAQNRFVSMTSHEFRTPLSVIVSSADLLGAYADKWTPENRDKHLKRIDRAARGMTDLLDGLLLIGRTDAGHREFRPANVQLDALVTESVEAQRLRAKDGITVSLALPDKKGPARVDPRLMRHVLDNLVSNGVKYSKPGGVVHVSVARDDDGMTLEVKDEGIGIPPEHLGRLFDSFSRAKNVGAVQGTGLGLAIVKRAVDQHSGTIRASSELGVGTTFVVRIPIERGLDSDAGVSAAG